MGAPLSPEVNSIEGCRPDCPLLESCRAQGLKRCPMRIKTATISLPLVHSLLLHAVVAALILMLPVYGGSGQRSFMSYRVFLAGGEGPAPSHGVSVGARNAPEKPVAPKRSGPEKTARPQKKAGAEKVRNTPERNASSGPAKRPLPAVPDAGKTSQNIAAKTVDEKAAAEVAKKPPPVAAPTTEKAPQNATAKTVDEKAADTEMAEEVVRSAVAAADNTLRNVPPETTNVKAAAQVAEKPSPGAAPAADKTPENVPSTAGKADAEMAEEVVRSAVAAADNALQMVPPGTAPAEIAEEAVKEPAESKPSKEVRQENISSHPQAAPVLPKSSAPSPQVPDMGQFTKRFIPGMGEILSYHGVGKEKSPPSGKGSGSPASGPASEKRVPQDVAVAPGMSGSEAAASGQDTQPNNGPPETSASEQAEAAGTAPAVQLSKAMVPGLSAGGQQTGGQAATQQGAGETVAAGPQQPATERKAAPVGISGAAALLPRDIIIKVVVSGEDGSSVFMRLSRRSYPSSSLANVGEKERPVKAEEESGTVSDGRVARILSVVNADKGVYTFAIRNAGSKACVADAFFLLFEKTSKERTKEYKVVRLLPGTGVRFKFLLPDAIFWDDDNRFSGSMEDSDSITKFNSDTGLVWREEKSN